MARIWLAKLALRGRPARPDELGPAGDHVIVVTYILATTNPRRNDVRFHTTILQGDKTATGIQIPDEVVGTLGAGKRPPIR
jgi:hypothetical protein